MTAMMHRRVTFTLMLGLGLLSILSAAPRSAWGITTVMNDHVVIQGDTVRLGDLFEGFDLDAPNSKAKLPIGQAPAPGERTVYDISRLAAIARAHDVDWRPRTWSDRVVVERASQKVGQEAIQAALRSEFKHRGSIRKIDIELAGRGPEIYLPTGARATIAVQHLDYDERAGRFTAVIAAPAESPTNRMTVQGRVYELVEVPVLAHRLNAGEVIGKDDLEWTAVRSEQVNRNILTDASRLIGQEVRRGMSPGQSVRTSDIRSPVIVGKGSIVTMILQTPKMQLMSKGRAMDDASMGDAVRIMNTQSKTVIEATVVGTNTVQVVPSASMPY